jgi:hypothetical protein
MPLRWPGDERVRFLSSVSEAFASPPTASFAGRAPRRPSTPSAPRPIAFQFYDPDSDVALLSSISVAPSGGIVGTRLLLLDQRGLALFLGENRAPHLDARDGPRFATIGPDLHLDFDGWLLALSDPALYLDIEHAFAASDLVRARVALSFRPCSGNRWGRVRGWIERDGRKTETAGFAFADASLLHRPLELTRSHLSLSASFAEEAYLLRAGTGRHRLMRITPAGEEERKPRALRVELASDRATPEQFEVHIDGEPPLVGEPLRRIAIHRALRGGRTARTTFGIARFRRGDESGFGFYDYSRILGRG